MADEDHKESTKASSCNGKITIRKPKKVRQEGVEGINSNILQKSFITLVVGRPGSGKSHLMHEFVDNPMLYNKKFDRVFFCTPVKIPGLVMDTFNWTQTFDLEWIERKLNECRLEFKALPYPCNVLFILDDVISEIKKCQNNAAVMNLFLNRRHLVPNCTVSFFIGTQKYMLCPSQIRVNISSLVFFKGNNVDTVNIFKEHHTDSSKRSLEQMRGHLKTKHNFIYMNCETDQAYKDFSEQIK